MARRCEEPATRTVAASPRCKDLHRDGTGAGYRHGTDGDRGRVEGKRLERLTCDWLTVPFNVEFGKTPRHDTDDTNLGFGDTRTIRWMVKMVPRNVKEPAVRMAAHRSDGASFYREREIW